MTNSLQVAKKAFSVAVAATTILWSVGLSAFLPTAASAAVFGDVIKGTTLSTVYYYGSDGQRYSFPNEKTYFSWYNDFSAVKTISDSELAAITLAGNIVYRPGTRWVKITSDAKVYAVSTNGKVRWIENEATAKGLGGDAWNTHIDDVPDVFFTNYSVGDSLSSPAAGYDGMLWSDGTSKYLVAGTKYQKVTDAGFAANMYKAGSVLMGTGFTKSGLTAGADITVAMANLTDAAQKVTTPTYAVSQNVSVALSASSPSASTVVAGQALANLVAYDFTNSTSAAVSVKTLALHRSGVSSDSTLSNVYLFSGYTRLTDAASVSSGVVSFNDAGGLFTIPAGGKVTVNVRSDVAASTQGQTLGVSLNAASDITFVGAFAAAGTFPLAGALSTVASLPDGFGTVSFATATTPSGDGAPAPAVDTALWQNDVTVSNNEAWLNVIRFRNIGSIAAEDVGNWRLYVAGVATGSAVAKQDANGYITFDLSAAPKKLNTGTHTFKVIADIIGGSTRTISVSLRSAADAVLLEDDYKQPVLVKANNTTFSSRSAAAQTVATGELTFTKRSDSPSGNIVNTASNAVLARFDAKASGEAMKIESLNFNFMHDDSDTAFTLRNGAVFADGVQIGNTTALCSWETETASACTSVAGSGASYTTYNFGSSFVVYPGTPVVLEIRADIYDNVGNNSILADDTIQLAIDSSPTDNVLRKTSGSYISRPTAADVLGNVLSVKIGTMVVAKNTAYASQTSVPPKTAYKLGSFTVSTSTTEALNLNNLNVTWTFADAAAIGDLTNLYLEYGVVGNMKTSTIKTAPTASSDWSIDSVLDAGKTMTVNVFADVASTITDAGTADTAIPKLLVSATAAKSGGSIYQNGTASPGTAVSGQTSTWTTGSFVGTRDGSSPIAALYAGNQTVTAAKYRFTATNEAYTLDTMVFTIPTGAIGVASSISLYDDVTPVATAIFDGTASSAGDQATFNDLKFPVAAGSSKILTAKLTLNAIASVGGAPSQKDSAVTLASFTTKDSQGVAGPTTVSVGAGYEVNVTKSYPVASHLDLTNATLVNGQAMDLYKFTVTAVGGDVALKQLVFPIAFEDAPGDDSLAVGSFKFYRGTSEVTSLVNMLDQDGLTVESTNTLHDLNPAAASTALYVTWDSEDVITSGQTVTYTVRGTPAGFGTNDSGTTLNDNTFTLYLAGDGTTDNSTKTYLNETSAGLKIWKLSTDATVAGSGASATAFNFIWSDESGTSSAGGHVSDDDLLSSNDWANGYLVLSLDLPGETWSK